MIYFLCTSDNVLPIKNYLMDWGSSLLLKLNLITYEQLIRLKQLKAGTYIFSDIELLSPLQAEEVAKIWELLSKVKNVRLLNHPICSMKRYELLRSLYYNGWNEFNVYYINECKTPNKFPVFIRVANDHSGARTPLLNTNEELEKSITELSQQGKSKENRIITEFCNTSDSQGIYRKYSALIVGEKIIPISVAISREWMLKSSEKVDFIDKIRNIEEPRYLEANPHEVELRKIFQLARIDYGRIDYGILNGKIQTWEINTNPAGFYTLQEDIYKIVSGISINDYLSENIKSAFEVINIQTKYTESIQVLNEFKRVGLTFPLNYRQRFKLFLRSLLPHPYKTYPYKLLIRINIRNCLTKIRRCLKQGNTLSKKPSFDCTLVLKNGSNIS